MTAPSKDEILGALSGIEAPDRGCDLVAADMVRGLVVKGGNVGFSLEVAPDEGARMEPVRKKAEAAVRALPGVTSVTAVLTAHRSTPEGGAAPSKAPAPSQGARRHSHGPSAGPAQGGAGRGGPLEGLKDVKAVVAVASGKGGVGKSTIAVNLALGLAALGKRTGLLDADIYGPSIPRMMGLKGQPESDGKKLQPMERFGVKTMSIGYLVDEETPMIWRGPMVMSALTQMMNDVDWGALDVLVVDFPPGTGDAQLTMAQRVPMTGAVIVSTPQEIALIDARKALAMFAKTHVPIFGIVENMAWFELPDGSRSYIFGEGGARKTAETVGAPFLGEIPLVPEVRAGLDEGRPVTGSHPESAAAQPFLDLAREVAAAVDEALAGKARAAPDIVIED
jgi:ATP-binding protein involved in chromosome partitioning